MRKWIYMFMAAGLLLSACVKENRSGSAEGTPVLFSASTVETRTTYSGQVTDGYERIDWSENDQIKINCPQTTPTSATYKIGSGTASGKQSQATGITCTSGNQLQWGSGTHRFFAVYPSSADLSVSGTDNSTKGTMSGTIPATQDGSPALSSYGYMYASATESNPGMYQSVNLAFRPLFNAVEFSLKAGDPETAAQLTSIVLSSGSENLAGPFSAEWTAGSTTPTVNPGSSGLSQSVTISTNNVSLSQSTARKFTFITMPITQDNLTLTLNYANYYSRTLTLKNGSGTAVSLSPGERVVFGEISVPKKIVHVTGVTLNQSALNMTVGGADQTLTATVAPTDATDKSVSWSSSNTSVATVTNGVVHAVGAGTATITVTTTDGSKTATCTVTVTQPVSGVSVSPTSATLNVGGTQQLTATVSPSTASNPNVTWSSSNTSVATVSSSGLVTAVAKGTATITVTTADGSKTATCAITVKQPVTGVTVSPTSATLNVGGTQQLTATVAPSNANNKDVTWSSSNTSVATVSSSGLVTAVAKGTATITATTADGGYQASCSVTVKQPVTGVTVSPTSATLNVGGTRQLTATVSPSNANNKNVTWSSSNTSVATVSSSGLVTAVAKGTATITATTADGGYQASCSVTVKQPVTGVTVSPTSATLNVGGTQQLTATVAPSNANNKNVTWSSSNTSVATVSSSGLVTAVAAGSATITVTTADGGYTATCTVTVTAPEPNPYLFTFKSGNVAITSDTEATAIFATGSDYVTAKPFTPSVSGWGITNSTLFSPYGTWPSLGISLKKTLSVTKVVIVASGTGLATWLKVDGQDASSPTGTINGTTTFTWNWSSGRQLSSISLSTLYPFNIQSIEVTYK